MKFGAGTMLAMDALPMKRGVNSNNVWQLQIHQTQRSHQSSRNVQKLKRV